MAEKQGFEPWEGINPQRFSRPPLSTAQPPLRKPYIITYQFKKSIILLVFYSITHFAGEIFSVSTIFGPKVSNIKLTTQFKDNLKQADNPKNHNWSEWTPFVMG